jgi:hypothetical protein
MKNTMRRKFALMTVACLFLFSGLFTILYSQAEVVWTYYVQDFWNDAIGFTKISPDSKYIAMDFYHEGDSAAFRLLNIDDGSIYKDIIRNDTNYTVYLNWINDTLIATTHYSNPLIKIWNINTGTVAHSFNDSVLNINHRWRITGLGYCNGGKLFFPFENDSTYIGDRGKRYYAYPFDSVMVINTNNWQIERKFRTNNFIRPSENCSYYLEGAHYDNYGISEYSYKFHDIDTDSLLWHFDPPDHFTRNDQDLGMNTDGRYLVYSIGDTMMRKIDFLNKTYSDSKVNWKSTLFGSFSFQNNSNRFIAVGMTIHDSCEYSIFDISSNTPIYTFYDSSVAYTTEASRDSQYVLAVIDKSLRLFRINWNPTVIKEKDKEEPKFYFTISPNPASDYIEISGSSVILSEAKNLVVSIYDVLGVEVYCSIATPPATPQEGNLRIDISQLSPGVYFVQVGDVVSKFVKI